ncbi:hypothetical protein V2G26_020268 [Clonostachys chloroleuca]
MCGVFITPNSHRRPYLSFRHVRRDDTRIPQEIFNDRNSHVRNIQPRLRMKERVVINNGEFESVGGYAGDSLFLQCLATHYVSPLVLYIPETGAR